eukprot:scaffold9424_cov132-Isochrysis_galbana.AAC.1
MFRKALRKALRPYVRSSGPYAVRVTNFGTASVVLVSAPMPRGRGRAGRGGCGRGRGRLPINNSPPTPARWDDGSPIFAESDDDDVRPGDSVSNVQRQCQRLGQWGALRATRAHYLITFG